MKNDNVLRMEESLDRHGAELEKIEAGCDPGPGTLREQLDVTKGTRASALVLNENYGSNAKGTWGLNRKRFICSLARAFRTTEENQNARKQTNSFMLSEH